METFKQYLDTHTYSIYCDMDGVLTDIETQFETYFGVSREQYEKKHGKKEFYKELNNTDISFWSTMPWTKDGKELYNYIKKYNWYILTTPLKNNTDCKLGKLEWCSNNLDIPKERIIFSFNKYEYSTNTRCILIDDRNEQNVLPWIEHNGVGIVHTSTEKTISQLKKYINIIPEVPLQH
jgi:hypothetical protein